MSVIWKDATEEPLPQEDLMTASDWVAGFLFWAAIWSLLGLTFAVFFFFSKGSL